MGCISLPSRWRPYAVQKLLHWYLLCYQYVATLRGGAAYERWSCGQAPRTVTALGQQLLQVRRSLLFGPPDSKLCTGDVCVITPSAASCSRQSARRGLLLCCSTYPV